MAGSWLDDDDSVGQDPILILYSRPICHLCDVAKPLVLEAALRHGVRVLERNVEEDSGWEAAYGSQVPVAFVAGRKLFKYRVVPAVLERRLAAVTASE